MNEGLVHEAPGIRDAFTEQLHILGAELVGLVHPGKGFPEFLKGLLHVRHRMTHPVQRTYHQTILFRPLLQSLSQSRQGATGFGLTLAHRLKTFHCNGERSESLHQSLAITVLSFQVIAYGPHQADHFGRSLSQCLKLPVTLIRAFPELPPRPAWDRCLRGFLGVSVKAFHPGQDTWSVHLP